jgi:hypothetical protein
MAFVLTIDQRRSSRSPDLVDQALAQLATVSTALPFERTAGDELQGLLVEPASVVDAILLLVRAGTWHIGIGIGEVELPLPATSRAGRGSAYTRARQAVEAAKRKPQHLAVRGPDESCARQADAVLTLLAAVVERRSPAAWQAIDLDDEGLSAAEAAHKLGVSRQAVTQRLAVGLLQQVRNTRPVAALLLAQADGPAQTRSSGLAGGPA